MSACTATTACLLFSAYMEGASNDKLYDVQNRCNVPVSLADWELVNCGNGCSDWEHTSAFDGAALLAPGDVWRIAHEGAREAVLATASAHARAPTARLAASIRRSRPSCVLRPCHVVVHGQIRPTATSRMATTSTAFATGPRGW